MNKYYDWLDDETDLRRKIKNRKLCGIVVKDKESDFSCIIFLNISLDHCSEIKRKDI